MVHHQLAQAAQSRTECAAEGNKSKESNTPLLDLTVAKRTNITPKLFIVVN